MTIPDGVHASEVEALWRGGKRRKALDRLKELLRSGHFASAVKHGRYIPPWKKGAKRPQLESGWPRAATHWATSGVHLDVRNLPPGTTQALLTLWLGSISTRLQRGVPCPRGFFVFAGRDAEAASAATSLLRRLKAPFESLDAEGKNLHAIGEDVHEWLYSERASALFG